MGSISREKFRYCRQTSAKQCDMSIGVPVVPIDRYGNRNKQEDMPPFFKGRQLFDFLLPYLYSSGECVNSKQKFFSLSGVFLFPLNVKIAIDRGGKNLS